MLATHLPPEAAVWRQDTPDWTRQDEWAARTLESIEHWGPVLFMALTGGKGRAKPPVRIFDHPDRPKEKPKNVVSIAEFEKKMSDHAKGGD